MSGRSGCPAAAIPATGRSAVVGILRSYEGHSNSGHPVEHRVIAAFPVAGTVLAVAMIDAEVSGGYYAVAPLMAYEQGQVRDDAVAAKHR